MLHIGVDIPVIMSLIAVEWRQKKQHLIKDTEDNQYIENCHPNKMNPNDKPNKDKSRVVDVQRLICQCYAPKLKLFFIYICIIMGESRLFF